jgi:hypothetical protein
MSENYSRKQLYDHVRSQPMTTVTVHVSSFVAQSSLGRLQNLGRD